MKDRRVKLAALPGMLRTIRRLMGIAWHQEPKVYMGLLVTSLFIAAIPYANSGIFALLINNLVAQVKGGGINLVHLWLLVALVVGTMIVPGINHGFYSFFVRLMWIRMIETFEVMFISRKGELDPARHESPEFQDLVNNATERGMTPLGNLLDDQFENLQNVVGVIIASVVVAGYYPWLFGLILIGLIPRFAIGLRYGRSMWGIYDGHAEDRRKFQNLRQHFFGAASIIELKLFGSVERFRDMIRVHMREFDAQQEAVESKRFWQETWARLFSGLTFGAGFAYLIMQVVGGKLQLGTLTFLLASMNGLSNALTGFFMSIARQYEWGLFANDIFAVMDTKPVIESPHGGIRLACGQVPQIVFEDVSFAYPGANRFVLQNFSLTINPGQKIALVGENGSGKTTIIKLLCRFYDPTEGRVLVNGVDLRDIDLPWWHSILGLLSQDFKQYNFVAAEEIAMGSVEGADEMDRVEAAARASDAHEFILRWERRYRQQIGKKFHDGVDLSKSQLQKMALARVLHRDARVLMLDEPTASVDPRSEAHIFADLEASKSNRTVVLVSHRFSTVRSAQVICVVKNGVVRELGSHGELMGIVGGLYRDLFTLQAQSYVE